MSLSQLLDVAIGLVFVYCLLSLVCTAINEWIATRLGLRAATLEEGVRGLLGNDARVTALYEHPLVKSLTAPSAEKAKPAPSSPKGEQGSSAKDRQPAPRGKSAKPQPGPSYLPPTIFAAALLETITRPKPKDGAATDTRPKDFAAIRDAVANLADSDDYVKRALLPLFDAAEGKLEVARKNIEAWFDSCMARASGWYKRKTLRITLAIAVILTVVVNADTVGIARGLYTNASARDYAVAAATVAAREPAPGTAQPGTPGALTVGFTSAVKTFDDARKAGLPIGWPDGVTKAFENESGQFQPEKIPSKLLGLLLTVVAISMGAPVWFDILKRFVNIRGVGAALPLATSKKAGPSAKTGSSDEE